MFRDRGYHNVSLADVASAVGITAGALYRHFRNKEELLTQVVLDGLDVLDRRVRDCADLDEYIRAAGSNVYDNPTLSVLWQREARHLPEDQRRRLRGRLTATSKRIFVLMAVERPDLNRADVELLAWALEALITSCGVNRISVGKGEFERNLNRLAARVVHCSLSGPGAAEAQHVPPKDRHAAAVALPRRERLIVEATRLFGEHGYQSVSMQEIARAAGITGSTVYKHFASKDDLLAAAMNRGSERMHAGMNRALTQGSKPTEVLHLMLRAHIEFALENRRLIGILVSERDELRAKERKASVRSWQDYLAVWSRVLAQVRPELSAAEARMTLNVVFTIIDNLVRTRGVATRADLADRLLDVTGGLLGG